MATFGQIPIELSREELENDWFQLVGDSWQPLKLPPHYIALYRLPAEWPEFKDWLDKLDRKPVRHNLIKIVNKAHMQQTAVLWEFADDAEMVAFKLRWL